MFANMEEQVIRHKVKHYYDALVASKVAGDAEEVEPFLSVVKLLDTPAKQKHC